MPPHFSDDTQQVHRQTCHPGSTRTGQICKQACPCHHVAAVGYGGLTQTCLYCQMMLRHSRYVNRCACDATREHENMGCLQAQATVWLPPGHGSCVNRCAKAIRWWPWETGCRNRRTQAAYRVAEKLRPCFHIVRLGHDVCVNRHVHATRYLYCIMADVQTGKSSPPHGGPGDGMCRNRCGGATTWQHQCTAGM